MSKDDDGYSVPLPGSSNEYTACDCGNLMTMEHAGRYGRCYTCWEMDTFTIEERISHALY